MPPRYAYWTIIAGGLPTAFRAARKDELLPTFARIRTKHPDAEMKWFARGRLWESPEDARRERDARTSPRSGRTGGQRTGTTRTRHPVRPERGRDWRPGGEHRDPRQKFTDQKRARNAANRQRKFDRRQRTGSPNTRFVRNQGTEEPKPPPRPPAPHREPKPQEGTEPTPPPRPTEPVITPPGPPERGGRHPGRRRREPSR